MRVQGRRFRGFGFRSLGFGVLGSGCQGLEDRRTLSGILVGVMILIQLQNNDLLSAPTLQAGFRV